MKSNVNIWAFILSLSYISEFPIAVSSADFYEVTGIHPLDIVLGMTVLTFFLGLIGLKDVREWKAMARSIFTIIFTAGFSLMILFAVFVGRLIG